MPLFSSLQALKPGIQASWYLLHTRVGIARVLEKVPLPRLLDQLSFPETPHSGIAPSRVLNALSLTERVLARVHGVPNTCLYRALGRYTALVRVGIPVRFVMGLRREGEEIIGHAWLEFRERPLGEVVDPRFVVTYAYPDGPTRLAPSCVHACRSERTDGAKAKHPQPSPRHYAVNDQGDAGAQTSLPWFVQAEEGDLRVPAARLVLLQRDAEEKAKRSN